MSGGKRKRAGSRILQKDYLINLGIAGYMGIIFSESCYRTDIGVGTDVKTYDF